MGLLPPASGLKGLPATALGLPIGLRDCGTLVSRGLGCSLTRRAMGTSGSRSRPAKAFSCSLPLSFATAALNASSLVSEAHVPCWRGESPSLPRRFPMAVTLMELWTDWTSMPDRLDGTRVLRRDPGSRGAESAPSDEEDPLLRLSPTSAASSACGLSDADSVSSASPPPSTSSSGSGSGGGVGGVLGRRKRSGMTRSRSRRTGGSATGAASGGVSGTGSGSGPGGGMGVGSSFSRIDSRIDSRLLWASNHFDRRVPVLALVLCERAETLAVGLGGGGSGDAVHPFLRAAGSAGWSASSSSLITGT
mmetsp:Transcript_137735/g.239501  ORF Transcript_137735/g.239501 Transcript_137735/m.239501 type:complete len:306 (+) Transcript_137735:614-1531(+)